MQQAAITSARLRKFRAASFLLVVLAAPAGAADYFMYRDGAGRLTIGNQPPPAAAEIVKKYDWTDVTDAEIARTERENSAIAARNLERERIEAQQRLATAMEERSRIEQPARIEINEAIASTSSLTLAPRRRPSPLPVPPRRARG